MRTIKLSLRGGSRSKTWSYCLGVPRKIASQLAGLDLEFIAELTPEGILFRVVDFPKPDPNLPEWAKRPGSGGKNGASQPPVRTPRVPNPHS